MKTFFLMSLMLLSTQIFAGEIFKIEIGKDYGSYTDNELRRRVWDLERAVFQLQQKVFDMEVGRTSIQQATWICKTEAMGEKFSATGASKAVAENEVMEKCKLSPRSVNGFHCGEAKCSQ